MVVLCGLLDIPFQFGGTQTLKIKETDRMLALGQEMARLGITARCGSEWELDSMGWQKQGGTGKLFLP